MVSSRLEPQDQIVFNARKSLVIKYRQSSAPWPDGIDSKWDRWYRPEEWDDQGNYFGELPMPKRPEVSLTTQSNKPPKSNSEERKNEAQSNSEEPSPEQAEFDKKEYQKEYMRKKRAAEKIVKGEK